MTGAGPAEGRRRAGTPGAGPAEGRRRAGLDGAGPAEGLILERVVGAAEEGARLDQALAGWLGEPRSRTHQRLAAGRVTLDGGTAAKASRLRLGEVVRVLADLRPSTAAPPPTVPVRFEDADLIVVVKPPGLLVHPGAGHTEATLVDALRVMGVALAPGSDPVRPGVVHRLDRGTSGVLVLAKTERAFAGLVERFKGHDVDREYWALAEGRPEPPYATIDAPIARSTRDRTRFAVDPEGRPAVSHYDIIEAHPGAAEVSVRLETGRTHQVRVHLSAVGHPVAGDLAYGASPTLRERLGLQRPALHARRLGFVHPVTGLPVVVTEPPPSDLRTAVARLRGSGRSPADAPPAAPGT